MFSINIYGKQRMKYAIYMIAITIIVNIFLFVQIYDIIQSGVSSNEFLYIYIIRLVFTVSWLIYGIIKKDTTIIFASVVGIIGLIVIMILTLANPDDNLNLYPTDYDINKNTDMVIKKYTEDEYNGDTDVFFVVYDKNIIFTHH